MATRLRTRTAGEAVRALRRARVLLRFRQRLRPQLPAGPVPSVPRRARSCPRSRDRDGPDPARPERPARPRVPGDHAPDADLLRPDPAGERLTTRFKASGELYYVLRGRGRTLNRGDTIAWGPGDVFCLPGGGESSHIAGAEDGVLWAVTNQPALAFEHLEPPAPGNPVTSAVHYPAAEIRRQLERVAQKLAGEKVAGLALVFSSVDQARLRNVLPTLTLALNQLPPGEVQRPHRHNSAAITLSIQGERCYSMIGGRRVDWQQDAVTVTPPGEVHSHHNEGDRWMSCLIVQDGGLHYHCRTMDFSYADQ